MKIIVSGKHMDVGAALTEYVNADLTEIVSKYFEQAVSANVIFSKERYLYTVDIIVNEGTGTQTVLKADAENADVYAAYDLASEKIKKRLRRYKRRIKDHHKESLKYSRIDAKHYLLSFGEGELEHNESEKDYEAGSSLIIAESKTGLETLTVGDAVMKMDLAELTALMFINKKNGNINMIYRRKDGNIAWIDPGETAKVAA